MRNSVFCCVLCSAALLVSAQAVADVVIRVAVPSGVAINVRTFFEKNNKNPRINSYKGENIWRDEVELILLHQALRVAGYQGEIELVIIDDYHRILESLKSGQVTVSGTSMWRRDLAKDAEQISLTPPLIREGEFFAGLFLREDNNSASKVTRADDLESFTAVSNKQWSIDWEAMSELSFKKLYHNQDANNMVRMVMSNRVDFVLAPFPSVASFNPNDQGARLIPLEGVKVLLNGSRHWAVSTSAPGGTEVIQLLERGVDALREHGNIIKAYEGCGFMGSDYADWVVINEH